MTTKMKMLASTVQFSSYGRDNVVRARRRHPAATRGVDAAVRCAARTSPAPSVRDHDGHGHLRRIGRAADPSGPNSVPPATSGRRAGIVDVPPNEQPPWRHSPHDVALGPGDPARDTGSQNAP